MASTRTTLSSPDPGDPANPATTTTTPDPAPALLAALGAQLRGAEPDADADDGAPAGPQLLTFDVGGRVHACAVEGVREVLVYRATTRLPGAPPHVLGLLNLRGTLLTVVDLGARLGHGAPGPGGHVIVVEVDGRLVGCRVDAIRRVRPQPALLPLPGVGNAEVEGIVMGLGEVDGELVAVVDLFAIARQTLLFPGER